MTGFPLRGKIGATGTREGCTKEQWESLRDWFNKIVEATGGHCEEMEFHHGDCIGFDWESYCMALGCQMKTVAHPPTNDRYRAYTSSAKIMGPQGYMARNSNIVGMTDMLLAGPKEFRNEVSIAEKLVNPKGGTWRTVALAARFRKPVHFIFACGTHFPMTELTPVELLEKP